MHGDRFQVDEQWRDESAENLLNSLLLALIAVAAITLLWSAAICIANIWGNINSQLTPAVAPKQAGQTSNALPEVCHAAKALAVRGVVFP
jgi:hypothetical protein